MAILTVSPDPCAPGPPPQPPPSHPPAGLDGRRTFYIPFQKQRFDIHGNFREQILMAIGQFGSGGVGLGRHCPQMTGGTGCIPDLPFPGITPCPNKFDRKWEGGVWLGIVKERREKHRDARRVCGRLKERPLNIDGTKNTWG